MARARLVAEDDARRGLCSPREAPRSGGMGCASPVRRSGTLLLRCRAGGKPRRAGRAAGLARHVPGRELLCRRRVELRAGRTGLGWASSEPSFLQAARQMSEARCRGGHPHPGRQTLCSCASLPSDGLLMRDGLLPSDPPDWYQCTALTALDAATGRGVARSEPAEDPPHRKCSPTLEARCLRNWVFWHRALPRSWKVWGERSRVW